MANAASVVRKCCGELFKAPRVDYAYIEIRTQETIMGEDTRLHDGIAGTLILLGTLLGSFGSPYWLLVPGIIGALMLQSAFSGFCPVYFTLGKLRGAPR